MNVVGYRCKIRGSGASAENKKRKIDNSPTQIMKQEEEEISRRIFVVRHGESEWNVLRTLHPTEEERYHPRMWTVDCDIIELGVRQAQQAGKDLGMIIDSIDLLLISPLRRALQTAHHVLNNFPSSGLPKDVQISKDAAEVMLDPCDIGSIPSKLCQEFPVWDFSHLAEYWWHGGLSPETTLNLMKERQNLESDDDVKKRLRSLVTFLRESDARTIVIVCHGDLIWWLTRRMMTDGELFGDKAKNGEIIEITKYILGEGVSF